MDQELFQTIWGHAQQAVRPVVVNLPNEQPHLQRLAMPDGSYETIKVEPAYRKHTAKDIDTLVSLVSECDSPSIWYSREGVTVFFDDTTRRDQARFPLTLSPQLAMLQHLAKVRPAHKQRDFISLLRITFHDCLGSHPNLLPTVRKVRFKEAGQTEGEFQVGKQSVGKQLMAELCGYEQLPEELLLDVSIFEGEPVTYQVRCALDINPVEQTFSLIPLPNTLEYALQAGEDWLEQVLLQFDVVQNKPIPLYRGTP